MICKWYVALNHVPWVANLARFQVVFCTQLLPKALTGHNCSSKAKYSDRFSCHRQLLWLAAASTSSIVKWSESSILLYVAGHPVGGAFPLNLIYISFHTSPWETPIRQYSRVKWHKRHLKFLRAIVTGFRFPVPSMVQMLIFHITIMSRQKIFRFGIQW